MNFQRLAHGARILTMIAAAVALLAGMFLGPRAPIAVVAAIATLILAAVTIVARRL